MAQCLVELFFKKLFGNNEVEAALQKLDQLTRDEAWMAIAETWDAARDRRYLAGDQLQRDVQQWLSPPDPSTNHDLLSKKAHETGNVSWFFKSHALTEWKTMGSFLWIHGKRMIFNLSGFNSY
jgi:hypothetical protein